MPFGSVTLNPGINVEQTPTALRAGYSQSAFIRWLGGLAQKWGGFVKYYPFPLSGVPRDMHAWQDLNEVKHVAIGTTGPGTKLVVITNNIASDITPQTLISDFAPNFSTTINSNIVTVTDPNATNVTIDDTVFFNTPVSVGGLILFGKYPIIEITGSNSYQIEQLDVAGNPVDATSTASPGVVPTFGTIAGSTSVTVTLPNHGVTAGDTVVFQIPTVITSATVPPVSVTIEGAYQVNAVVSSSIFTITINAQAGDTQTVQMNGGNAELVYYIALGPSPAGVGFGLGGFGLGGFGTGQITGGLVGTEIEAVDWTSDNWGEILLECPQDGAIYFWDPTSGFTNAQVIPNGPTFNRGIFVSSTAQILIAYGSSVKQAIGEQQQALLVQWSNSGDFTNWLPLTTDQAGNFTLSNGSLIVAGASVANQNFLWTDEDLWAMNYIGPPLIYGFNKIGAGMGAVSGHAIQQLRGSVFWMAPTNFCAYSGGGAQVIPCPVWDSVFQNINREFIQNVRAMPNTSFNEVGWLWPSNASTSGECDSFVKFNITEPNAPWDYTVGGANGQIGGFYRSAWIDLSVVGMPLGATPQGIIYQHEMGFDADTLPLTPSFQTGYFYISDSEDYVFVDQVLPDFKFGNFPGSGSAQIQLTFYVVNFPTDTPTVYGPFAVSQMTEYISVRFRGRMVAIGVSSADIGSFWRLGSCKFRYTLAGRR